MVWGCSIHNTLPTYSLCATYEKFSETKSASKVVDKSEEGGMYMPYYEFPENEYYALIYAESEEYDEVHDAFEHITSNQVLLMDGLVAH
jgi:hypothetical protein